MSEEERSHFIGVVAASLDRLERLVRRLVDLARAEMMRPGAAPVALTPLLERVAERYRGEGLRVCVRGRGGFVDLPQEGIEIALSTLLDNIVQHAGPAAEATIEATETAAGIEITVADNGRGISAADRDRIFEPFFTTARATGGSGLGLPIVRAIVTAAGGAVEALPRQKGASFRITLPAPATKPAARASARD
jgi:signal transduction histidine kinase